MRRRSPGVSINVHIRPLYSRHHGGSVYLLYETIGLSYLFPRGAHKFLFIGLLILCGSLSFMMFAH